MNSAKEPPTLLKELSISIDGQLQDIALVKYAFSRWIVKASVADLRYRLKEILKAIDPNEEVTIRNRGKGKGVIKPKISGGRRRISDHHFFNMCQSKKTVQEMMADLRGEKARAKVSG
jgi:hypothetical protein